MVTLTHSGSKKEARPPVRTGTAISKSMLRLHCMGLHCVLSLFCLSVVYVCLF